jgi:predicted adenine nucleotide alpha hydrolase (AANH) superfamily ATPase
MFSTLNSQLSTILLHTCCAPCSAAIVERLMNEGIIPTLYYYNPNIFPQEEYVRRKAESIRHAASVGIDFVDADYDHDRWLEAMKGLESEPERGRRCLKCFQHRLYATAEYAYMNGFKVFATTLATSRHKSIEQIEDAGMFAASHFDGLEFIARNWRKGGLQQRRNELVKQFGFYNQTYCGCEFS